MPKLFIEKEIEINETRDRVKEILLDFNKMKITSPWFVVEPSAKETTNDKKGLGSIQKWEGEIIGSGEIEITNVSDDRIDFDLLFLKPWKSKAKTYYKIKESKGKTTVTWGMNSSLPWFMFFMKKTMITMIGMDYNRGLMMLKEYIETGVVSSKMQLDANATLEDMYYMGLENKSRIDDIGSVMSKDFETLIQFSKENNIDKDAVHFAIYNKFDLADDNVEFISAVEIDKDMEVKAPYIKSKIQHSDAIKVRHIGDYQYLGNAWSLLTIYARAKKIKVQKKPMGYEFYVYGMDNKENCNESSNLNNKDAIITDVFLGMR